MKILEKICVIFEKIATFITVGLMIFLTLLIATSVFSRFVFNNPIAWQYEATLLCLSWVVFIGMSITFRLDEHMRLTFVPNAMKPKTQAIWLAVMDAIVVAFLIAAGIASISVIQNSMGTKYQTIPINRGYFYLPFPIGCLFSVFHIVNTNVKRLKAAMSTTPADEQTKVAS